MAAAAAAPVSETEAICIVTFSSERSGRNPSLLLSSFKSSFHLFSSTGSSDTEYFDILYTMSGIIHSEVAVRHVCLHLLCSPLP